MLALSALGFAPAVTAADPPSSLGLEATYDVSATLKWAKKRLFVVSVATRQEHDQRPGQRARVQLRAGADRRDGHEPRAGRGQSSNVGQGRPERDRHAARPARAEPADDRHDRLQVDVQHHLRRQEVAVREAQRDRHRLPLDPVAEPGLRLRHAQRSASRSSPRSATRCASASPSIGRGSSSPAPAGATGVNGLTQTFVRQSGARLQLHRQPQVPDPVRDVGRRLDHLLLRQPAARQAAPVHDRLAPAVHQPRRSVSLQRARGGRVACRLRDGVAGPHLDPGQLASQQHPLPRHARDGPSMVLRHRRQRPGQPSRSPTRRWPSS